MQRAAQAARSRADGHIVELIDAVQTQLALESMAMRALRRKTDLDLRSHALAHACMRLALLRVATSASSSHSYSRSLHEITASCGARSVGLADAVRERLDAGDHARLTEQLADLCAALGSKLARQEAARSVIRCELSLQSAGAA